MDSAGASNCLHAWNPGNPDIDGSFGAPADANVVCVQCSCGMWLSIAHWSTEPGKACNETGGNQDTKDPRSPRNKSEERLVRPWTAANHSKSKKRIQRKRWGCKRLVKSRDLALLTIHFVSIWQCNALKIVAQYCTESYRKLQKGMATHHNPRRFTLFSIFF